VLFVDGGRIALDAPRLDALAWLGEHRPAWVEPPEQANGRSITSEGAVCTLSGVGFAYPGGFPVLDAAELVIDRHEVVALVGPNGSGKTTLAKLATGLLEPAAGTVERRGRAAYLSQDPGRYLVKERVLDEVALGADSERA